MTNKLSEKIKIGIGIKFNDSPYLNIIFYYISTEEASNLSNKEIFYNFLSYDERYNLKSIKDWVVTNPTKNG